MIYEMRTYTLKAGAVPEFEKKFEAALPVRLKYSELAAFWHTEIGPLNQVIHVWPYDSLNQRMETRAKLAQDPGWPPPDTADLIVSMNSEIFNPAPFSPQLGGGQKLGNVYEMRIYQYQVGAIPTVIERWEEALKGGRLDHSQLAACMWSDIGALHQWVHFWPYPDLDERTRVRTATHQLPTWPPKTREFIVTQANKILIPASFSPTA